LGSFDMPTMKVGRFTANSALDLVNAGNGRRPNARNIDTLRDFGATWSCMTWWKRATLWPTRPGGQKSQAAGVSGDH